MHGVFEKSLRLVRLMLRRERILSTVWLAGLVAFSVSLAAGMGDMFEPAARQALAITLQNPGMIAMMGPVYGADHYTVGAMYANTMTLWVIIAVAVMNIFLVVRHTRGDEEKGRAEVLRSLPSGRLAMLNAAMITAVLVNAALALLTGLGLAAVRAEGMGFGACMLYGAMLGVSGLLFAAIAALFAQLSASARGAIGYSFLALGTLYMLRAVGDIGTEALSWISPLGLIQRAQVFTENHWGPVLVVLLEAIALMAAAYALNSVRDLDQSFLPARPGRRHASAVLRSSLGLALRLLRGPLAIWIVAMLVLGAAYGALLGDIEAFVAESPFYQMVIGANDTYGTAEMYAAMVNTIAALMCLVPLLTAVLKPRAEEKEGHTEQVLARTVSRTEYLTGYVAPAVAASVLLQCATALGLYASARVVLAEPIALSGLLRSSLVYLPALWVMMGLAILLIGLLPRATGAIWGYFAFSFFTAFLGRLIRLPAWLPKASPFGYVPQMPMDGVNWAVLAMLTAVAAVLMAAGFACYRKREVVAE